MDGSPSRGRNTLTGAETQQNDFHVAYCSMTTLANGNSMDEHHSFATLNYQRLSTFHH